ncbi:hypothetical protein C8F01DRAFT_1139454, partial [Mycena amicta]
MARWGDDQERIAFTLTGRYIYTGGMGDEGQCLSSRVMPDSYWRRRPRSMKEKHGEEYVWDECKRWTKTSRRSNSPARSSIQTPQTTHRASISGSPSRADFPGTPRQARKLGTHLSLLCQLRLGARTVHRSETTACAAGYSRLKRRQAELWRLWKTIRMLGNSAMDVHARDSGLHSLTAGRPMSSSEQTVARVPVLSTDGCVSASSFWTKRLSLPRPLPPHGLRLSFLV